MDPFVLPGQMAGIERRAKAAAGKRLRDRVKDLASWDPYLGRRVPGRKADEVGGRELEEVFVMFDNEARARGEAAPVADRGRGAVSGL